MKLRKKITALLLMAALICALTPAALAADPVTYAACDVLVNVTRGETYYTKDADSARDPASLTKLMTVYMIYEAMARGEITKNSTVTISAHTGEIGADVTAVNVPLTVGQRYTVDELLAATMVVSACNAASALGEKLGGTESNFAAKMTARAKRSGWAMSFTDASGLDGGDRMTARAAAALASALLTQYPDVLNYSARTGVTFRGKYYKASNQLLPGYGYAYSGADGLKTGTTSAAGRCLVATAMRNGQRLVAVVLGGGSDEVRFGDAIRMLDSGFSRSLLVRSTAAFTVDGAPAAIHAYNYADSCFVCLRDLSAALAAAGNGFSIAWDAETNVITLNTGVSASALTADVPATAMVPKGSAPFAINGSAADIQSYTVGGVTYASLRDLAPWLGFETAWDGASNTVALTVAPAVRAKTQKCTLDGRPVELNVCLIRDTGYYKLRDVAAVLSGTAKQFDVAWDPASGAIALTSGNAYTPDGGELAAPDGTLRFAKKTNSSLALDGQSITPAAYNIGDNNYFRLRDLGAALGFGVDWDNATGTVVLTTAAAASSPSPAVTAAPTVTAAPAVSMEAAAAPSLETPQPEKAA